jgi:hypothetical protein
LVRGTIADHSPFLLWVLDDDGNALLRGEAEVRYGVVEQAGCDEDRRDLAARRPGEASAHVGSLARPQSRRTEARLPVDRAGDP